MKAPAPIVTSATSLNAESPWIGLRSYSEESGAYFFGRQNEVEDLFERIRHSPLTILFGQSGLGKTSLIQAALVPRLRKAGFIPVLLRLNYDIHAPALERQVLEALRKALRASAYPQLAEFPESVESLWLLLHHPLYGFCGPGEGLSPVLIFDQFEEIFTLGDRRQAEVLAFRDMLASVVENRVPTTLRESLERDEQLSDLIEYNSRAGKVLICMRDDFLHLLERWRKQMPSLMANRMELRQLNGLQALMAVVEPGRLRPGKPPIISPETGATIVRFVAKVPEDTPLAEVTAVPPLLSLICAELNARRLAATPAEEVIRSEQLQGKSEDVLQNYYRDRFVGFPPVVRNFVEDRLLSSEGFRESVNLDTAEREMTKGGLTPEQARKAIGQLVDERLLTVEQRGNSRKVELTHDILTGVALQSRNKRSELAAIERAEKARTKLSERTRRQRRQLRRTYITAVSVVLVILLTVALINIFGVEQRTNEARQRTQMALTSSETLIQFILVDLTDKLKPMGRLDLLRDLTQKVQDYYESNSQVETDPVSEKLKAKVLANLGDILREQGDLDGALTSYQNALALLLVLTKENPQDRSVRQTLAGGYGDLGEVLDEKSRDAEAIEQFEKGIQMLKEVLPADPATLAGDPANRDIRNELATLYREAGDAYEAMGQPKKAIETLNESVSLSQQIVNEDPANIQWRRGLMLAYAGLGDVQDTQNDLKGAEASDEAAARIEEKVLDNDPDDLESQFYLAKCYFSLGSVLAEIGNDADARAQHAKSLALLEKVIQNNPNNRDWQAELALDYLHLSEAASRQGNAKDAVKYAMSAVQYLSALVKIDPTNQKWQSWFARASRQLPPSGAR